MSLLCDNVHSVTVMWLWLMLVVGAGADCNLTVVPVTFWNFTCYQEETQQLHLMWMEKAGEDVRKCIEEGGEDYTVQLVKVERDMADMCCERCPGSKIQEEVTVSRLEKENVRLLYVVGDYMMRLTESPSVGYPGGRSWCSGVETWGEEEEECSGDVSGGVIVSQLESDTECMTTFDVTLPMCPVTRLQHYSQANMSLIVVDNNMTTCPDILSSVTVSETVKVRPCQGDSCPSYLTNNTRAVTVTNTFSLYPNLTYCVWVQLIHPNCDNDNHFHCNFHLEQPSSCQSSSQLPTFPYNLSEPMFIGLVVTTLGLSLICLLWIVVRCRGDTGDKLGSGGSSLEPLNIKTVTNMPRSLTIDEMEHICRLKQQELVLVYFPDTERFKDLNTKFRDWLLSLDILNVNDVTDIYDDKYSEGNAGVLRNPESWVANLLTDPERRVVLVTSRLAYECLIHLRKGLDPPKFPEHDSYSDLLVHMLKFLDSDLFKGNYRRLICVRYEDLKICDRRYGSESFNIVPGTEYLLPQHLEDICRWIHPVEARPGLWADHRPQVKNLMESIKSYRHQEDNIFTISFYNGTEDNGAVPLLSSNGIKDKSY